MSQYPKSLRRRDRSLLTLALGSVVLLTPLFGIWVGIGCPWYGPFILWLVLIGLGLWNAEGEPEQETRDPVSTTAPSKLASEEGLH